MYLFGKKCLNTGRDECRKFCTFYHNTFDINFTLGSILWMNCKMFLSFNVHEYLNIHTKNSHTWNSWRKPHQCSSLAFMSDTRKSRPWWWSFISGNNLQSGSMQSSLKVFQYRKRGGLLSYKPIQRRIVSSFGFLDNRGKKAITKD